MWPILTIFSRHPVFREFLCPTDVHFILCSSLIDTIVSLHARFSILIHLCSLFSVPFYYRLRQAIRQEAHTYNLKKLMAVADSLYMGQATHFAATTVQTLHSELDSTCQQAELYCTLSIGAIIAPEVVDGERYAGWACHA